ncbi:hypothetical protein [Methylobacterium soli]|uniref:Uncharacterized protein n=1 Tax=Methylobacterium soli TaxID=553447 RepID=A0A6L3STI2_9HYPH|nr:hypothetical protein [Methylobacterium soli]KAB1072374.1 hypothetical protein F6X53_28215 [Methylobacterium soli]GJE46647.1 hypothetical protein AEGHOMDF_5854 [Methylobacterium soli]
MANFARVVGGVAVDVSTDPAAQFHPDLAAQFAPVPNAVRPGWRLVDGTWEAPPAPEGAGAPPAPAYRTLMTPIRFKAQFSVAEQVAIKRARTYVDGADPTPEGNAQKAFTRDALDVLFGSLDDPHLAEVDVADPSVIGRISFCASVGILTAERAAAIKLGVPE